jgi:hypothetical protein
LALLRQLSGHLDCHRAPIPGIRRSHLERMNSRLFHRFSNFYFQISTF